MKFDESLIFDDKFWKLLKFLEAHENESYSWKALSKELQIEMESLTSYFTFLGSFQISLDSFKGKDGEMLLEIGYFEPIQFELSFSGWLALQAHFPLTDGHKGKALNHILKDELQTIEGQHVGTSLFDALEIEKTLKNGLQSGVNSFVIKIEEIKKLNITANITLPGKKNLEVYFYKLVHLDGELNVIGEEVGDGALIYLPLKNILSIRAKKDHQYTSKYSIHEINDFIQAMRTVMGSEERLVLKVKDQSIQSIETGYHFMANPYITSNMEGDIIWAISVEVSDKIFQWLFDLGDKVEILDPTSIKEGFEIFKKERSSSYKKAA